MSRKIRVGILFGGKSAEHEVSLQSAKNVIDAIDREKYEVVLIGMDKAGRWFLGDPSNYLLHAENPKLIALNRSNDRLLLAPGGDEQPLSVPDSGRGSGPIDVVFPVVHGTYGEDGSVQGLLKLAGLPFVGAGILGSAVGMDKDVMKRLLRDADIPSARFRILHAHRPDAVDYNSASRNLGTPLFIKPANLGSSVGVHKVYNEAQFRDAVEDAFRFDHKLLIEEFIAGREIECAVLGNERPQASLPGEVLPHHDFYSYEAKYIDEHGAALEIPAKLSAETTARVREMAIRTFTTLCCSGMARVDCFLKENGELLVNEINTIPGFTRISMYPKLWEVTGIGYAELIDRLIQLALERSSREQKLQTSYA